jgi:hypothetical protein
MTVVVAFHCSDGVVLAVDSMLTPNMGGLSVGHHHGQKISILPGPQIFALAGDLGQNARLRIIAENHHGIIAKCGPLLLIMGVTRKNLGEVGGLEAPLLMHLGEEDEFISKAAQAEIKAALAGKPNATVYSYPGQRHAFARHNGAHYDATAATLANARTREFLHRQLQ